MRIDMLIGNHLSASKGYAAMGKAALALDANTFAFFTRNPRGGKAKEIDEKDVEKFLNFAKEHLPKGSTTSSSEVPSSGAARALLMRVYLQRAGYSLNRETVKLTRPDDNTRSVYFNAVIDEWEAFQSENYHSFVSS